MPSTAAPATETTQSILLGHANSTMPRNRPRPCGQDTAACYEAATSSWESMAGRRRSCFVSRSIARKVGGLMWCSIPSTS